MLFYLRNLVWGGGRQSPELGKVRFVG